MIYRHKISCLNELLFFYLNDWNSSKSYTSRYRSYKLDIVKGGIILFGLGFSMVVRAIRVFFYKRYTILDTPMSTFAVTFKTVQPKTIWDTKSAVFWSIRHSSSQSNRIRETRDLCKAFSAALVMN